MRYEYIEPFVVATKKVIASAIKAEVAGGDIALVTGSDVRGEVSIVIRVKGDSEGCIIVNMDTETARKVCGVMSGPDSAGIQRVELDTIAELSNMIAGNATSSLNDLGHEFNVYPPLVIAPADIPETTEGVEIFRVPLTTPCGEISINVALRMN